MEPLVSIIMPVYNAELYVGEAIKSVLDQTYQNWELIVVNDGSIDNSEKIILGFQDTRVKYVPLPHGGVSRARNRGLSESKGMYLSFLDADDLLTPSSISSRVHQFQTNHELVIVDGGVDIYDSTMKNLINQWCPSLRGKIMKNLFRLDERVFFGITWMIKIDSFTFPPFDEELTHAEDLLFFLYFTDLGTYDYVESVIYKRRVREKSAMTNIDSLGRGYLLFFRKASEMVGDSVGFFDRMMLIFKIKKIMFLTYWRHGNVGKAMLYLFHKM